MLVEDDERIDLHAFYDEFIRPGRGNANVVAEVEDDAAEAELNKLLSSIDESHDGRVAAGKEIEAGPFLPRQRRRPGGHLRRSGLRLSVGRMACSLL